MQTLGVDPDLSLGLGVSARATALAAVDVGSTSVHLLVARLVAGRLDTLRDESVLLRLGARVDAAGALGEEGRRIAAEVLLGYVAIAAQQGAETTTIVGTDAIRRAHDGGALFRELSAHPNVAAHVLRHEEEGLLTLIGVVGSGTVSHETLVVDLGGGSSEFVRASPGREAVVVGLPIGAAGLTAAYAVADPPGPIDIERIREAAGALLVNAPSAAPQELVVVGGTASNVIKVLRRRVDAHGRLRVSRADLREALAVLSSQPAHETSRSDGVNLTRARILPAGVVVLQTILDRYGLDELRVSQEGIREGTIRAVAALGPEWPARLPAFVSGRLASR